MGNLTQRRTGRDTVYSNGTYSVQVSPEGFIDVKAGDWLSKYSAAIYDNTATLDVFYRLDDKGRRKTIDNKNLIRVGESLVWFDPTRAGTPRESKPVHGEPAPKDALVPDRLVQFFRFLKQWFSPISGWEFQGSDGIELGAAIFTGHLMSLKAIHRGEGEGEPYTFYGVAAGLAADISDFEGVAVSLPLPGMNDIGVIAKCITAGRTLSADEICGSYIVVDVGAGLLWGGSLSVLLFGFNGPVQAVVRTLSRYLRGESESILLLPSLCNGVCYMAGGNLSTPNFGASFKLGVMHRRACVTG